jgi:GMP synthase (glutamine-hydrolysing)
MNILVIQNSELDPIGVLGEYLEARGSKLHTWLTSQQENPPEETYSGLIIMGGSMNAHEDDQFPHLRQTVELIHQFHADGKPIMGVCLGAQLIARAFGSQVYPHRTPEIGFTAIRVASPSAQDLWLKDCPEELHLMQWHFDTFDLPSQATLLMTNDVCQNQAYRIGSNIYGFQFHLEVTPEIVMSWLVFKNDWIEAHYPNLEQQLEEQIQTYIRQSEKFAETVAEAWLNLVSTSAVLPLNQALPQA